MKFPRDRRHRIPGMTSADAAWWRPAAARRWLRRWPWAGPTSARERTSAGCWREGDRALAAQQTSVAVEAFSGAVALKPQSMLPYLKRGDTYLHRQDWAAAERDLRQASDARPDGAPAPRAAGRRGPGHRPARSRRRTTTATRWPSRIAPRGCSTSWRLARVPGRATTTQALAALRRVAAARWPRAPTPTISEAWSWPRPATRTTPGAALEQAITLDAGRQCAPRLSAGRSARGARTATRRRWRCAKSVAALDTGRARPA